MTLLRIRAPHFSPIQSRDIQFLSLHYCTIVDVCPWNLPVPFPVLFIFVSSDPACSSLHGRPSFSLSTNIFFPPDSSPESDVEFLFAIDPFLVGPGVLQNRQPMQLFSRTHLFLLDSVTFVLSYMVMDTSSLLLFFLQP